MGPRRTCGAAIALFALWSATASADDKEKWLIVQDAEVSVSQSGDETEVGFSGFWSPRARADSWTVTVDATVENATGGDFRGANGPVELGVEASGRWARSLGRRCPDPDVCVATGPLIWVGLSYELAAAQHEWHTLDTSGAPSALVRSPEDEYLLEHDAQVELGGFWSERGLLTLQFVVGVARGWKPADEVRYSLSPGTVLLDQDGETVTAPASGLTPSFHDRLSRPENMGAWTLAVAGSWFPSGMPVGVAGAFYLLDGVPEFGRLRWELALAVTPTQSSDVGTAFFIGVTRTENVASPDFQVYARLRTGLRFGRLLSD